MIKDKKIIGIYPSWEAMWKEEDKKASVFRKIADFFEYRIFDPLQTKWYNIRWYFRNRRTFRKVLWEWRPWGADYQTDLFAFGLEQLADAIENGHEVRESAKKKVQDIRQLAAELRRDYEDEVHERHEFPHHNLQLIKFEDGTCQIKFEEETEEQKAEYQAYREAYEQDLNREREKHYATINELIRGKASSGIDSWWD